MTKQQQDAINEVATAVHLNAVEKGWHALTPQVLTIGDVATFVANVHGEVSELWEASRRNELYASCDKGIPLTNLEEELADIVIRTMDFAAKNSVRIGDAILAKHKYNKTRSRRHGGKLA